MHVRQVARVRHVRVLQPNHDLSGQDRPPDTRRDSPGDKRIACGWRATQTCHTARSVGATYTYDAANRLKTVTADGVTTSYTYNGDGDRISQTVDGVTTTYVLDVGTSLTMVLSEKTGTDPAIYYLHGLGLVAQSDGTNTEYFHTDGLGSVRQMTNALGSVLLAQTFDPYDNPYLSAAASGADSTYGWAGEQTDGNGLVFLRARYYNPSMGRFLNLDPSRQEPNPLMYAFSNPVLFVDRSGRLPTTCPEGFEVSGDLFGLSNGVCVPTDDWPEGAPPGQLSLMTPKELAALGFTPANTDPLPLKFYMDPEAFRYTVGITYANDPLGYATELIFTYVVPNCLSQFDIPNPSPGFDEMIATVNLTDLDADGRIEFQRYVVDKLFQEHIGMQAEWYQAIRFVNKSPKPVAIESFPVGPKLLGAVTVGWLMLSCCLVV